MYTSGMIRVICEFLKLVEMQKLSKERDTVIEMGLTNWNLDLWRRNISSLAAEVNEICTRAVRLETGAK